jgi:hypothetical protein
MSLQDMISKPADRPLICTVTGDAGLGKTTFAATFPNPVVLRAEDGLQAIPADQRPDALPVVSTADEVWRQLGALINEEHDYKTLVVDSVTALERLFIADVVESDPKKPKSINQALGGYGAGTLAVGAMHQRVRKAAGMLNAKGMHVVFIAHADTEVIELPDQDPYTRYNLRLGKKSIAPYVDDVDLVGYIKLKTFLMGDERKRAMSNGERVLVTYATAANVSKNRLGITDDLELQKGENPLTNFVSL